MKLKPKVGDTVWALNVGNAARHTPQTLTECTVQKVGKKYFTVGEDGKSHWKHTEFHLDTWRQKTNYSVDVALYSSPQEWEDEKETEQIHDMIYKRFQYGNHRLSITALRRIRDIIQEESK